MTENRQVLDHCVTCQFPINPVDAASKHSFIGHTIPAMQKNNIGILAMKSLADGRFFAKKQMKERTIWTSDNPVVPNVLSIEECIHFSLSLPIATLITGAEIPEYVQDKADMVRRFSSQPESYRKDLAGKVADFAEAGEVEYYKNKELRMQN